MVTGAIGTAAAALVEGTVAHQVIRSKQTDCGQYQIRIAHPYGVLRVEATRGAHASSVASVSVERTAREIMDGIVHVPSYLFSGESTLASAASLQCSKGSAIRAAILA